MATPSVMMTLKEVREELKISNPTLYEIFKRGELKRTYVGPKTVRVSRTQLERFLSRKTR